MNNIYMIGSIITRRYKINRGANKLNPKLIVRRKKKEVAETLEVSVGVMMHGDNHFGRNINFCRSVLS